MAIKIAGTTVIDDSRDLVNIGTVNGKNPILEKQVVLNQYGELELFTGTDRWYAPTSLEINNITGRLYTASNNGIVTFRVNKVSGGTTTSTSISFTSGSNKVTDTTTIALAADDYITVDIISVGNANDRGSDLNVIFTYEET